MCCSVQFSQMETFFTHNEESDVDNFPVLSLKKNNTIVCANKKELTEKPNEILMAPAPARSKLETANSSPPEEEGGKKKKKKWKKLSLADTGFKVSLFPRPTTAAKVDAKEEAKILRKIESEINSQDEILCKCAKFVCNEEDGLFDGKVRKFKNLMRRDRDGRVQKAGRQVKDKYCSSVKNNTGRKKLYIHHRLFKIINLEVHRMTFLPSPKYNSHFEIKNKDTNETRSRLKPYGVAPVKPTKPAPVQNLRHTLHETNAPTSLETTLVNLLISLQHREVTPEDYELLLQLDDSVAPKTLDKSLITSFKTDTVTEDNMGELCPVCMDQYEIGQNRKFLPCDHVFHASCIDMWLENSSQNCPIDNLPVDRSS